MNVKQEKHIIDREKNAKVKKTAMEHNQLASQMALNEQILNKNAQIEGLAYKPHFGPEEQAKQVLADREKEARAKMEQNYHLSATAKQKSAEKQWNKNED